ncbi:MAG: phosphatase PAP2 family protein [Deltaproteobacteria bacterium]|nr:phosphatase PAP2 family protein [Deltaproteobacteria bacterium]
MARLVSDSALLKEDFKSFYLDAGNLRLLGLNIAGAGLIANSSVDRELQEYYRDNLRSDTTDSLSDVFRAPGEILLTVPVLLGARYLTDEGSKVNLWAGKSLRAMFVGAPAGLLIQYSTGGGRPKEGDSHWRPFKNNNGLSGHSFIGAVPFITAARMEDNKYSSAFFYGVSVLPALSRINDDEHYFSQALLGWSLAYLSVAAIDKKDLPEIAVVPRADGYMVYLNASF